MNRQIETEVQRPTSSYNNDHYGTKKLKLPSLLTSQNLPKHKRDYSFTKPKTSNAPLKLTQAEQEDLIITNKNLLEANSKYKKDLVNSQNKIIQYKKELIKKDKIIQALCGEKFIGKSKTAQYGKVLIEKLDSQINTLQLEEESLNEVAYLYIDSHLALFNGAVPTWIPTKENLGLMQGEILWEKTQIKTRKFSPFNSKRQCRETERLIIEKGSVIAISNLSKSDRETLKKGVGAFLSEGYGKILINPSFLLKKGSFSLKTEQVCYHKLEKSSEACDENLICYLKAKKEMEENNLTLGEQVEKFIEQHKNSFKKVSNSQWGEIRMRLQFYPNNYKDEILEYIKRGDDIKPQWKDGEKVFVNALEQETIEFLKLLANMMPKAHKEGDNE